MLQNVCQAEFADQDTVINLDCARTASLVRALDGCMHPVSYTHLTLPTKA